MYNRLFDLRLPLIWSKNQFAGMKAQQKARVKLMDYQRAVEKLNINLK